MSSKDKSKIPSNNSQRNISDDRNVSNRKPSTKSNERERHKIDGDKITSKDDIPKKNVVEKGIGDDDHDYEREERRRKRREKDNALNESIQGRDVDKLNGREKQRKELAADQRSNDKRKSENIENNAKQESKSKYKSEKEDSKIKYKDDNLDSKSRRRDSNEDSKIRQRDSKEDSKGSHRVEKDDSTKRHKDNKVDSRTRHRDDKEDSTTRHRDDKDSKNRHRTDKIESSAKSRPDNEESKNRHRSDRHSAEKADSQMRHRTDRVESSNRRNVDKVREENPRKSGTRKDRTVTDGRGDKTAFANGKKEFEQSVTEFDKPTENQMESFEYDKDFDDYNDEDFEEVQPSSEELSEEQEIQEESSQSTSQKEARMLRERVSSPPPPPRETPKNKDGIHASFINFKMAQKKCSDDVVANRMLARAYDLSRLIDLDRSHFDIVDIAPVWEHSKYMMMFGRAGCQHIGTQNGDDNMGRECQTDVIDERTVWTQHPQMEDEGCARVMMDTSLSHMGTLLTNDTCKTALEMLNEAGHSSAPLVEILELMDRVLEEEASPEVSTKIPSTTGGQQMMSLGYNKYSSDGLPCICASFASGNSAIFATVHQQSGNRGDVKDAYSDSFVSIWRVSSNYREPQRNLSCPNHNSTKSCITSLTFSPDTCPSHLLGGLDSGLIALWDLREHSNAMDGNPPAYFTGVPSDLINESHQSPVIALHTSSTKTVTSSYQLLSMDASGRLSIWIVSSLVQIGQWAVASGSLADLNLRPGSKTRMSIVSTVALFSGLDVSPITGMAVDPGNTSQILIGNQNGHIIEYDRTGQNKQQPHGHHRGRVYGSIASFESGSVMFLDFYPFFEPYFLAGYSDGSLKIFTLGRSEPLLTLFSRARSAILMCRWSKSHPAIFFSLDCDGNFAIWNILENIYRPIFAQSLPRYIGFDLSCDSRLQLLSSVAADDKAVNNKARLLIWALDGAIEVHELQSCFVVPDLDDGFKTCSLLESLL